jgi:hypothetical protein
MGLHERGRGRAPIDLACAVALYRSVCDVGNVRCCTNLGVSRASGVDGVREPTFAVFSPTCRLAARPPQAQETTPFSATQ